MRIETDGDRVLVTFDEIAPYTADNGMTVNPPCGLYSVQAIASWQTLLGIDSVEDTLRAMFEANDTGSGEDTWAPVYEALEAALAAPQARTLLAATPAENASDKLAQARVELRRKLGIDTTQPAKTRALAASTQTDHTTLPDGFADRVSQARKTFIQTITPKDNEQ
ncbi:hypothetical protein [Bifidobacterium pullorum]|uniref:hypothetical protein n=1 Tax=Bifidobacterium pullorum TaxID=78448 RepID=UPI00195E5821|nr:hypothetical protein [Bifidobacterium pullorum]